MVGVKEQNLGGEGVEKPGGGLLGLEWLYRVAVMVTIGVL